MPSQQPLRDALEFNPFIGFQIPNAMKKMPEKHTVIAGGHVAAFFPLGQIVTQQLSAAKCISAVISVDDILHDQWMLYQAPVVGCNLYAPVRLFSMHPRCVFFLPKLRHICVDEWLFRKPQRGRANIVSVGMVILGTIRAGDNQRALGVKQVEHMFALGKIHGLLPELPAGHTIQRHEMLGIQLRRH